ncbi:nuclear receptor coactivator 2 isoform X3 [Lutzomyia longipalpis]|uniref:nuclear receptor coactivator 2 isoform X3 n=1 Tax=Lutzomyia longipalpis TaxID=7200 RepID=UPI002483DDE6|nr:nuclear receptor coactivator 2 isoform X3 [Lutzomyia longipalpis]
MSIVAAENAGLGPCDLPLPDQWVTHSHTQLSHLQSHSVATTSSGGVIPLSLSSPATTAALAGLHHHSTAQQHSPLQQSSKIMNAVAPAVACPPTSAATKKIRRKQENKPQSQINKCNNEKRRRELENEYIEQLGEFLQINKRDMTSCKPDKAAILNEVVKTFRTLLEKGSRDLSSSRCSKCPPDCADSCTVHPVQQGDVSSTEPPLPEPSVNGQSPEISAYFEAVEHYISSAGWVLLEINAEGIIECVTENIKDLIAFTRAELSRQSIYSYLHPGDHGKLSPILNNMSFTVGWGATEDDSQSPQQPQAVTGPNQAGSGGKKSIKTRIRMLVKHPDAAGETIEQKQQRLDKYEEVVIIAAPVKDDGDECSSVLCLITRPEDDGPLDNIATLPQRELEQLTLKIEPNGKIINLDASTLRETLAQSLAKEPLRAIHDLCHVQDHHVLKMHLKEVTQSTNSMAYSSAYRLRLGAPESYVRAKVTSKLFRSTIHGESDFIMAVHTILDGDTPEGGQMQGALMGPNHSGMGSHLGAAGGSGNSGGSSMGGPLMTSVMNGGVGTLQTSNRSGSVVTSFSSPPASDCSNFFATESLIDFDIPHSTILDMEGVGVAWDTRPDSRASVTPVSTPRPPSVSAYSPVAAPICPSPLTYHAGNAGGQPSPQNNNNNSSVNNNTTGNFAGNFGNFTGGGSFEEKEKGQGDGQQMQMGQQQGQGGQNHDSERLRNLLTTKRTQPIGAPGTSAMDTDANARNTNRILKVSCSPAKGFPETKLTHLSSQGLLNAEEEKDAANPAYGKMNAGTAAPRMPQGRPRPGQENKNSNNNMLLQLLNDKSDDDDPESRGNRAPSELLRQLQKEDTPKEHNHNQQMGNEELIQLLRFQGNDFSRKRSSNEPDEGGAAKRSDEKPSLLRERNKMLASLLANPSKAPTTVLPSTALQVKIIPDITPSSINSRVTNASNQQQQQQQHLTNNNNTIMSNNNNTNSNNQKQIVQQLNQVRPPPPSIRKPSDVYLNQMPSQQDISKNQQVMQSPASHPQDFQVESGSFATSTAVTPSQPHQEWDPELNEILNEVIDIVPDTNYPDNDLNNILAISTIDTSSVTSTPVQSQQQDLNEKLMINAIQKSLMQFENNSVFNSSPPAYPAMHSGPSAGGSVTTHQQQSQGFPAPPPIYSQRSQRMPQMIPAGHQQQQQQQQQQINANTVARFQLMQQHRLMQQQQQKEQRERLLQQQQKQQMVVPVNATAGADQLCLNPGMTNIESLLNNTVAPNVSLQRSTSVVSDAQLSPGFTQPMMQQQQQGSTQRTPFSPQPNQGYQQASFNTNNAQRLSPLQQQQLSQQQQQQQQQQQMGFTGATGANGSAQLSPRQPPFGAQSAIHQQQTPQTVATSVQQQQQWTQQQANVRLSLQQQQNPMLNAQLTNVVGFNSRQFQTQRQRSLNSPGTPVSRQNSFPGPDGFPGPPSPTQSPYGAATGSNVVPGQAGVFNQQQLRMQRQASVPQATQHLPGSPRSFGAPDATGYGMIYNNMQHAQGSGGDFYGRPQSGANNNGAREFLRAHVQNRQTGQVRTPQSPHSGMGQSPLVGNPASSGIPGGGGSGGGGSGSGGVVQSPQQQMGAAPLLNTPPDQTMGFNFDMSQSDFFGGSVTR